MAFRVTRILIRVWIHLVEYEGSLRVSISFSDLIKQTELTASKLEKGLLFSESFKQSLLLSVVVKKGENVLVCMFKPSTVEGKTHHLHFFTQCVVNG